MCLSTRKSEFIRKTRMHSSGMRTVRSLPYRGGSLSRGGLPGQRPPCGQTDTSENITLPQTSFAGDKNNFAERMRARSWNLSLITVLNFGHVEVDGYAGFALFRIGIDTGILVQKIHSLNTCITHFQRCNSLSSDAFVLSGLWF